MIKCEGIKAFRGSAVIRPKNPKFPERQVSGDWVYKPEWDCWYCGGSSYPSEIVCDIQEELMAKDLIGEIEARIKILKEIVTTEENVSEIVSAIQNVEEWLDGKRAAIV